MNFIETLENYPGFEGGISGYKLIENMKKQLENYEFKFLQSEAHSIKKNEDSTWEVDLVKEKITTRTIIVSVGTVPRKLGVDGEDKFLGKGISYCAMCDAPFFKNKEIAVIGGGNVALEEALYLSKFASKVTVVHRRDRFRADAIFVEKAKNDSKIEFALGSVCSKITGENKVGSVELKNNKGDVKELAVDGVFIFIGMVPQTGFLKDLLEIDDEGYIITNDDFCSSNKGIYIAGDCRKGALRQVISACGDGAKAAYSANKFLAQYD